MTKKVKPSRKCEYCGTEMLCYKDEDGYWVFDCPNCMNTWYMLERDHNAAEGMYDE